MDNIFESIIKKHNFKELMPIQKKFYEYVQKKGYNNNLIISAPTTSGKTLIAELLIEKKCELFHNPVILYIAPMISLLQEKENEYRKILSDNINICRRTSQFDTHRPNLMLATPEIVFEIIKTDLDALDGLSFVIFDEGHLLASKNRGFSIDLSITFLKMIYPNLQFLIMSATMGFISELQEWLNADYIEDKWRAVKLNIDIRLCNNRNEVILSEIAQSVKEKKSIVIFRATKRNVHGLAKKIKAKKLFSFEEENKLYFSEEFKKIKGKSKQDYDLENTYLSGIGIHHADIRNEYKKICEEAFGKVILRILVCTTTLGLGINLPIETVIISQPKLGKDRLTPSDFFQLAGRAGRTGFSDEGKAILLVSNTSDEKYWNDVKKGKISLDRPKSILKYSDRTSTEFILRLIDTRFFNNWENLEGLLKNLFSAFCSRNETKVIRAIPDFLPGLQKKVQDRNISTIKSIQTYYTKYGLVTEENNRLELTSLGRITLEFNLLPHQCLEVQDIILSPTFQTSNIEEVITALVRTLGLYVTPVPGTKKNQFEMETKNAFNAVGIPLENSEKITYQDIAIGMLFRWIENADRNKMCDEFDVWLTSFDNLISKLSGIIERFAKIIYIENGDDDLYSILQLYYFQIKYGVEEDLVPLVEIPNIGQKRAIGIRERLKTEKAPLTEERVKDLLSDLDIWNQSYKEIAKRWNPNISPKQQIKLGSSRNLELLRIVDNIINEKEENRDFECKQEINLETIGGKKKFSRYIASFANAKGGFLVIGVTDKLPRDIIGIRINDYKREKISSIIEDRIKPSFDKYSYSLVKIEGKQVLIIEVDRHGLPEPLFVGSEIPYRKDGRTVNISIEDYNNFSL